jgi:Tol biopolymer transport system component
VIGVGGHGPSAALVSSGRIVFQSDRDGNNDIYSMNVDGTDVRRLTVDPASDENAVLSYDGAKIAFVSHRAGQANLYSMASDGTGLVRLTAGVLDLNAGWSPTRGKIAFSTQIGSSLEIAIMNSDGTAKHVATHNTALDAQPHWSADGKKIAFIHDYRIAVFTRGSGVATLTDLPIYEWPHWSPDGTRILFHSIEAGNHQIYVMNADGSKITRITNDSFVNVWPVWSPDGTAIAFQSNRDGDAEIYTMNADGSNLTQVTDNSAADDFPSWSSSDG